MTRVTRRQALRMAALSVSFVALAACSAPSGAPGAVSTPTVTRQNEATAAALPSATPTPAAPHQWGSGPSVSITPIADFFDLAINQRVNWFDNEAYALHIGGLVERPLTLSLADIKALPAVESMRTIECIGNASGGSLIGNAVWKGVRFADIVHAAGVRSSTLEIKVSSADGYATAVPLALATRPESLLVYEMNGEPLPGKHGAPLRAIFPGLYGQKDPKWVTDIEAIGAPFLGFWESRGWSNQAMIRINTQMRTPAGGDRLRPGPVVVSGTVLGNESGVARLEFSADGGQTWADAQLVHGPTPLAWSEWRYQWQAQAEGDVTLMARATANDSSQQPLTPDTSLEPDAATEGTWHVHRVRVVVET